MSIEHKALNIGDPAIGDPAGHAAAGAHAAFHDEIYRGPRAGGSTKAFSMANAGETSTGEGETVIHLIDHKGGPVVITIPNDQTIK